MGGRHGVSFKMFDTEFTNYTLHTTLTRIGILNMFNFRQQKTEMPMINNQCEVQLASLRTLTRHRQSYGYCNDVVIGAVVLSVTVGSPCMNEWRSKQS